MHEPLKLDAIADLDCLHRQLFCSHWGETTFWQPQQKQKVHWYWQGAEFSRNLPRQQTGGSQPGLPPVLGELLGGVVVGISALHLLVFPESGADSSTLIMTFLQTTAGLPPDAPSAKREVIPFWLNGCDHPAI